MKTYPKNAIGHRISWYQAIKTWFLRVGRWLTAWDWQFVKYVRSTRDIHKRYHALLRETRESLLVAGLDGTSLHSLQEQTEKQKCQLDQLQTVREVYQRSVQRLYDCALLILLSGLVSYLAFLALRPEPTVTVQLGIQSNTVDLRGVLPSWSMHGADESDQILHTDKSISVANVDWIEHNKSHLGTADTKRFKLKSIDRKGRPSQLSLDDLSFKGATAHLSLDAKNNTLFLSVGTDGQPITVKGTLCKNGCLGELSLGGVRSGLDTSVALNFGVEAKGKKQLELAFSVMPELNEIPRKNALHVRWEDIPLRDNITFTRPLSDTTELSTIESGWLYILQTRDTIKLGKHDELRMSLTKAALASVGMSENVSNLLADHRIDLLTNATCEVSELEISQGGFKRDLMPSQIEVMAEQKDKSLLFALIGLLATLFVPLIFRNRL